LPERSACAAEGYGLSLIIHRDIQSGLYIWQASRTIKHTDRKEMQTVGEKRSIAAAVELSRVAILSRDTDTKAMKTSFNYLKRGGECVCLPALTFSYSAICPHRVYLACRW